MILGRLGRMAYINTLPVDWGLVHSPLGRQVKVYRGTPTTLNRLLAEGKLDVSAVSSVAAIEHAEEWVVLDHLCIGCRGEVGSVILHSDRPVEELNGRSIAVTAASATAARLLEILLARHWKVAVDLVEQDRADSRKASHRRYSSQDGPVRIGRVHLRPGTGVEGFHGSRFCLRFVVCTPRVC